MKKSVVFASLFLFSLNLVSASLNNFNNFSLSDLLRSIDGSTVILSGIFLIAFGLMHFSLSKFFRGKEAISIIISSILSLFIIWGINSTGIEFQDYFYEYFGLSDEFIFPILAVIFLILFVFVSRYRDPFTGRIRYRFYRVFIVLGLALLGITIFTDWIYEAGIAGVFGAILLLFGLWRWRKSKECGTEGNYSGWRRTGRIAGGVIRGGRKLFKRKDSGKRLSDYQNKQALKAAKRQTTRNTAQRWGYFGASVANKFKKQKPTQDNSQQVKQQKKAQKQAQKQQQYNTKQIETREIQQKRLLEQKNKEKQMQEKAQKQAEQQRKAQTQINEDRKRKYQDELDERARFKKRTAKRKNLMKEIQQKEAELRKWTGKYQRRINNPKKASKLKNHVLRIERELNKLKIQLNKR